MTCMLVVCRDLRNIKPPNCEIVNIGAKFENFYCFRKLYFMKEEARGIVTLQTFLRRGEALSPLLNSFSGG